jgi:hypothetical protein
VQFSSFVFYLLQLAKQTEIRCIIVNDEVTIIEYMEGNECHSECVPRIDVIGDFILRGVLRLFHDINPLFGEMFLAFDSDYMQFITN